MVHVLYRIVISCRKNLLNYSEINGINGNKYVTQSTQKPSLRKKTKYYSYHI